VEGEIGTYISPAEVISQTVKGEIGGALSGVVVTNQKVKGTIGSAIQETLVLSQKVKGSIGNIIRETVVVSQVVRGSIGVEVVGQGIKRFYERITVKSYQTGAFVVKSFKKALRLRVKPEENEDEKP
jgi:hypothetical protein